MKILFFHMLYRSNPIAFMTNFLNMYFNDVINVHVCNTKCSGIVQIIKSNEVDFQFVFAANMCLYMYDNSISVFK